MNTIRTHRNSGTTGHGSLVAGIGLLLACLWTSAVWGGIVKPLYVGNMEPVLNEYGEIMPGSRIGSGEAIVSLVEIRLAHGGMALPPSSDGTAHPYNPLVQEDAVGGIGMNAMSPDLGLFAMLFRLPPDPGTEVFARVYNAPTAAEASFYVDSGVVDILESESSLLVEFGAPQAVDSGDDDGDGLINSWEKSMGTDDRPSADYDGDGMSDLDEMRAGTEATNSVSLLAFKHIESDPEGEGGDAGLADMPWQKSVSVSWQSVPGKTYQLEYSPIPMSAGETTEPFTAVGDPVTAGDGEIEIEILVDVEEDVSRGMFRVRLVEGD